MYLNKENDGRYSRSLYFDKSNNTYIKLWHPDFYYLEHFQHVFRNTTFFSSIAKIVDVIVNDAGLILGYVTFGGIPIVNTKFDTNKYRNLRDRLIEASNKSSVIYLDFNISNVVDNDGIYNIVDLEASIPFNSITKLERLQTTWEHNDFIYRNMFNKYLKIEADSCKVVKNFYNVNQAIIYSNDPMRVYIEKTYLPSLAGKILFIGTTYYTDFYYKLVQTPETFETLDVLESAAEFGSPYMHYICNVSNFYANDLYDHVCFFGIFGHNAPWEITTNENEMRNVIIKLAQLVKVGGTILIGPALQTLAAEFLDGVYSELKNYDIISKKKIGINYVFYGRKLYS